MSPQGAKPASDNQNILIKVPPTSESGEQPVIGDKGRIDMEPATAYGGNHLWVGPGIRTPEITPPVGPDATTWAGQLDHLVTCIREDREPIVSGQEGLRDMRIITAIYQSAREGRRIPLTA